MSFPVLSSTAISEITKMIDENQFHVSVDDHDWHGNRLLHLEVSSEWSLEFECWLLDRHLQSSLENLFEHEQGCRAPSRIAKISVLQHHLPEWHVEIGQPFACRANLVIHHGVKRAIISSKKSIWPVGFKEVDSPMNLVHFFSGAFCGWNQAQHFVDKIYDGKKCRSSISIDDDPIVCKFASRNLYAQLIQPVGFENTCFHKNIVIQSKVQDSIWMEYLRCRINGVWTASFPCQPYSRGGNKSGLDTYDGRSLLFVLKRARIFQPICICLENVDGFDKHPHRNFIIGIIQWAGYRRVWSQIHNLNSMSPTTTCFGVFVRQDLITPESFQESVQTNHDGKIGWNHPMHCFDIPEDLQNSLIIPREVFPFYNCKDLLPVSMRNNGDENGINARVPDESNDLATLVASYSSQHHLPSSHLKGKGIFGEVVKRGEHEFAFIDPCKWFCLLGGLQLFVFPSNLCIAFHHLGNCIAVPQAVLALLIAVNSSGIRSKSVSIPDAVRQAWDERITSVNISVSKVGNDFGVFTPNDFLMHLKRENDCDTEDSSDSIIMIWPDSLESRFHIEPGESVGTFLLRRGFPMHLIDKWGILIHDYHLPIQGNDSFPHGHLRGNFFFGKKQDKFPAESIVFEVEDSPECVSPTAPWTCPIVDETETMVPLKVTLPNGDIRELSCLRSRTIEEVLILAGYIDNPDDNIHAEDGHSQIDLDTIVGSIDIKEIVFTASKKRKPRDENNSCVLEVTTLSGVTSPTCPSMTIEQTLQEAGFTESFIRHLTPEMQGKSISMHTAIADLSEPFIRLRSFPLRGGVGATASAQPKDVVVADGIFQSDPWAKWKSQSQTPVRWDQLKLPDNHPFFAGGQRLKQVQAMQIGLEISGIAFATKATAASLVSQKVCRNTVLLLPGFRGMSNLPAEIRAIAMPAQQIVDISDWSCLLC